MLVSPEVDPIPIFVALNELKMTASPDLNLCSVLNPITLVEVLINPPEEVDIPLALK